MMNECKLLLTGSPPLTRVLPENRESFRRRQRITPAYAGTTDLQGANLDFSWDHPRLRGYYRKREAGKTHERGSPPLTRVLHTSKPSLSPCWRITPAYAGTTIFFFSLICFPRDHPRLRGYYYDMRYISGAVGGSPPLTRVLPHGKSTHLDKRRITPLTRVLLSDHVGVHQKERITPAYAGTTRRFSKNTSNQEDHPRLRGYYSLCYYAQRMYKGSPPLTRVLLSFIFVLSSVTGITPAYAGTTATLHRRYYF